MGCILKSCKSTLIGLSYFLIHPRQSSEEDAFDHFLLSKLCISVPTTRPLLLYSYIHTAEVGSHAVSSPCSNQREISRWAVSTASDPLIRTQKRNALVVRNCGRWRVARSQWHVSKRTESHCFQAACNIGSVQDERKEGKTSESLNKTIKMGAAGNL